MICSLFFITGIYPFSVYPRTKPEMNISYHILPMIDELTLDICFQMLIGDNALKIEGSSVNFTVLLCFFY